MDAKELRGKSAAELTDELLKLRKEQFALRMQRATGQAPKPDQFTKVRRNIARFTAAAEDLRVGKFSGAVGIFAHLTPELEEKICARLGPRRSSSISMFSTSDPAVMLFSAPRTGSAVSTSWSTTPAQPFANNRRT